jgi:hypothetical protein
MYIIECPDCHNGWQTTDHHQVLIPDHEPRVSDYPIPEQA